MTRVVDGPEILEMRRVARSVPIARPVQAYAIRLTLGSHPGSPYATPLVTRYVRYGASPRAAQALVLAGKIHAINSQLRVEVTVEQLAKRARRVESRNVARAVQLAAYVVETDPLAVGRVEERDPVLTLVARLLADPA